jgi:HK97 family phage major capsid protein
MDTIKDTPDLSTPEQAKRVLTEVHRAARELRDDNGKLRGDVERMAADLKAAQQSLVEARKAMAQPSKHDGELGRYITERGIRWTGKENAEGVYLPGLLDDDTRNEWQGEFQKACEDFNLIQTAMGGRVPQKAAARLRHLMRQAPDDVQRAFDSQSGSGGEFIPAPVLPTLEREVVVRADVMGLFQEIAVSSNSQTLPIVSAGLRPYLKGTVTSDNPAQFEPSSLTTAERTIAPKGLAVRVVVDDDASEDAIFDMLPMLRDEAVRALSYGIDDCIINGDTAGSPADSYASWDARGLWGSSSGGSIDHRKAWIGLRARANDVSNKADRSTFSYATFLTDVGSLAAPRGLGGTEGELIALMSPEAYFANVAGLEQVATMEKYGPGASVMAGEIGRLGGARIVLSDFVTADLNASGNFDNTTTTKSGVLLLNASRFKMYTRRGRRVELQRDATRGITHVVCTWRGQFKPLGASTTKDVHWAYNMGT